MPALREIFAEFGIDFNEAELNRANRRVDQTKRSLGDIDTGFKNLGRTLSAVGTAIAGVFAIGEIREQARAWFEGANEIGRWSDRLRVSADDMVAWSGVASRVGADIDDVTDSLNDLRIRARDALTGQVGYTEAFELIGITHEDLQENLGNTTQLMDLFIDRLASHEDAATRAFVADELLSDAGIRMLPAFEQGAEAIQRQRREIVRNNRATIQSVVIQRQLNPRLAAANEAWNNLRSSIALRFLPVIERVLESGGKVIKWIRETIIETDRLEQIFMTLGIAAVGAAIATIAVWGPSVAMFAGIVAVITGLYLLINDLWVTMKGGDSVIKRVVDGLFGIGATAVAVGQLNAVLSDTDSLMESIYRWIEPTVNLFRVLYRFTTGIQEVAALPFTSTAQLIEGGIRSSMETVEGDPETRGFLGRAGERFGRRTGAIMTGLEDVLAVAAGQERPSVRRARVAEQRTQERFETPFALAQTFPEMRDVFLTPAQQAMTAPTTIDAPMSIDLTINEATNARETERIVRTAIRETQTQQLREIQDTINRE